MPTRYRIKKWMVLIFLMFSSLGLIAGAQEGKQLKPDLTATLSAFAKQNGLSNEQLRAMLGDYVLNSRTIPKGGVGRIGEDESYVVLDEEQNAILIGDKEWKGKNSKQAELVILGDHRVLGSVDVSGAPSLKIILFSPEQVRYVDLSNNSGANYPRHFQGPHSK
jgi:hypothetical protein